MPLIPWLQPIFRIWGNLFLDTQLNNYSSQLTSNHGPSNPIVLYFYNFKETIIFDQKDKRMNRNNLFPWNAYFNIQNSFLELFRPTCWLLWIILLGFILGFFFQTSLINYFKRNWVDHIDIKSKYLSFILHEPQRNNGIENLMISLWV